MPCPLRRCLVRAICTLSMISILPVAQLTAQTTTAVGRAVRPSSEILDAMAEGQMGAVSGAVQAFQRTRTEGTNTILGNYERYSDADRQLLLDGMEEIASGDRRSGDRATALRAQVASFTAFASIARGSWDTTPEAREIPGRLLRIYERADHSSPRNSAVFMLGELLAHGPPESPSILALLFELAAGPWVSTSEPGPEMAVRALIASCDVGRDTLLRLSVDNLVTDAAAAMLLREAADQGFSREMSERRRWSIPCP